MAPGVDEARVVLPQPLGAEAEAVEGAGPQAGQEDVRAGQQADEDLAAPLGPQMEGDRPLAPVGHGQRQVDAADRDAAVRAAATVPI